MRLKFIISLILTIIAGFLMSKIAMAIWDGERNWEECFVADPDFSNVYQTLRSPIRNSDLSDNWSFMVNSKYSQPRAEGSTPHRGIDLPVVKVPLYSVAPGIITYINFKETDAKANNNLCRVIIQLDIDEDGTYDDVYYVMSHISDIEKNPDKTPAIWVGKEVTVNDKIAYSGRYKLKGNNYHLHWGLTNNTNIRDTINPNNSDENYNHLNWRPVQKYYSDISEWRNGRDCDFISNMTFDNVNNKVSVYCYINSDGRRYSPREVILFYRIHGTSIWQPSIIMDSTTDFGLYTATLPSSCVGQQVDILIRGERDLPSQYYCYGWFPQKYYRPDPNPNATSHPYAFYTVQCGGIDTISPGETKSVDSPVGTIKQYKLTIDKNGTYAIATSLSSVSCATTIKLLDAEKKQIAIDNGGGNGYARLKQDLAPGTYFIDVSETGNTAPLKCNLSVGLFETINPGLFKVIKEPKGAVKYYQFNISSNGLFSIVTSKWEDGGDTTLTLYDSNYNQIAIDGGAPGVFAKIERALTTGTYYLELKESGNDGPLKCNFSVLELITPGETKNLNLSVGQIQTYELRIASGNSYNIGTQFYLANCDTVLVLYDSKWTQVGYSDNNGLSKYSNIFISLTTGTYYVVVYENGRDVPLQCSVSVVESSVECIYPGDTKIISQPVGTSKRYQLIIDTQGPYTIETEIDLAPCDTTLKLFDANNNQIAHDDGGEGVYAKISPTLAAGIYFIEVQEHGNDASLNCTLSVKINYELIEVGEIKYLNEVAVTTKIYQFNVNFNGSYSIETGQYDLMVCDTSIELLDENNIIIAQKSGTGYQKIIKTLTPGVYFIRVSESGNDAPLVCTLSIHCYESIALWETKTIDEPAGTIMRYEIQVTQEDLHFSWISECVSLGTRYYNILCDTILNLYDSDGILINSNDDYYGIYSELRVFNPGTYYLEVQAKGEVPLQCLLSFYVWNRGIFPGETITIYHPTWFEVADIMLLINETDTYTIRTQFYSQTYDTRLVLYNSSYDEIGRDDNSGDNGYSQITITLTPGYYFLAVYPTRVVCLLTVSGGETVNNLEINNSDSINDNLSLPESPHPYPDNYDSTWTYGIEGASSLKVTFDPMTEVESGFDRIYVMDSRGFNVDGSPFSDTQLAGKTVTVPGGTVNIRLTSDGHVSKYGFKVSAITGVCAPVSVYPGGGNFDSLQNVIVTCGSPDAVIHYTTDGTDPTESSPIISTGGNILVNKSMILKFRAFRTGWEASEITSEEYYIDGSTGVLTPPTISLKSGTYNNPQTVSISSVNTEALIRYTVDGSEPIESSTLYTGPISVNSDTILKARTFLNGWSPSGITSEEYRFQVADPIINIHSSKDNTIVTISMACDTQESVIRYTTDGSEPSETSNQYFGPFVISMNLTLKAKAFRTGWQESTVVSSVASIDTKAPYIFPKGGAYNQPQVITICSPTEGGYIYYTTDGTEPTLSSSLYSGPIMVTENMTIKAKAFRAGMNDSPIQDEVYTITSQSVLPESGHSYADNCDQLWTYLFNPQTKLMQVTFDALTEVEEGYDYLYIMDGSGKNIPGSPFTGTALANRTITVPGGVLKIRLTSDDSITKYGFKVVDIKDGAVTSPVIIPAGGNFDSPQNVTINCETPEVVIYYTLDGREPSQNDSVVSPGSTILINQSSTLKVKAYKDGYPSSSVSEAEFIITGTNGQTAMPVFSVNGGTIISQQIVSIDCSTTDAIIYYTTDGTEPVETSLVYQEPIIINETMTLKARAFKSGLNSSAINSVLFTKVTGIYVNQNAVGQIHDGSSWDNAYLTIKEALNNAPLNTEIWVAAGTYLECVTLKDTIAIYGGFSGTESTREQRDWRTNFSIIDGYKKDSVIKLPVDSTAIRLDGFVIRNGYAVQGGGINCGANSSGIILNNLIIGNNADQGGGVFCQDSSSMVISGNMIIGNNALTGAGIYTDCSSPEIKNNIITSNTSEQSGGGIKCNLNSAPLISNNLISHNIAYEGGSGIDCSSSSPKVINNTIVGNEGGSGIYYENSAPTIANNIIAYGSAAITQYSCNGQPVIKNNCLFGNTSENYSEGLQPGIGDFSDAAPLFMNRANKDYRLQNASPCINKGDDSMVQPGWFDLNGNARIQGTHVDIGAYESDPVPVPTFSPAGGTYYQIQNVTINCAMSGATIYYTVDGSEPTTSSAIYNGPIAVNNTTTLKAIAVVTAWNYSNVGTATYIIPEYSLDLSCVGNGLTTINSNKTAYHKTDFVTLTSVPDIGWDFGHWEEDLLGSLNPVVITVSCNTVVKAEFAPVVYSLSTTVIGKGTNVKQPDYIGFNYNDTITLTAVPEGWWVFDQWEGGLTSPGNIAINDDTTVGAVFYDTS